MAKLKVHAGDFDSNPGNSCSGGALHLYSAGRWASECIIGRQIEVLEKASEESVKRIGGTAGWGAAGAVILGPVGLLAGLIAGGRGTDVTFVAQLKDGRRLLATTSSKAYTAMTAEMFDRSPTEPASVAESIVIEDPYRSLDDLANQKLDVSALMEFCRMRDRLIMDEEPWAVAEPKLRKFIKDNR